MSLRAARYDLLWRMLRPSLDAAHDRGAAAERERLAQLAERVRATYPRWDLAEDVWGESAPFAELIRRQA